MSLNPQQTHYELIHDEFVAHYHDASSQEYRRRFVLDPLFYGIDFNGKSVLDLACGAGVTSQEIITRFPKAKLTGLDISRKACAEYEARFGSTIHGDLTKPCQFDERFDIAVVIGGLHHCVADLGVTMSNLAGLLHRDGMLLMFEPNAGFALESVRQWWYRKDRYFDADSEAALDHDALLELSDGHFAAEYVHFLGGPAYYLIFNSLITRVPLKRKLAIAPALFRLEALCNRLPFRWPFPAFIARWERTAKP